MIVGNAWWVLCAKPTDKRPRLPHSKPPRPRPVSWMGAETPSGWRQVEKADALLWSRSIVECVLRPRLLPNGPQQSHTVGVEGYI